MVEYRGLWGTFYSPELTATGTRGRSRRRRSITEGNNDMTIGKWTSQVLGHFYITLHNIGNAAASDRCYCYFIHYW